VSERTVRFAAGHRVPVLTRSRRLDCVFGMLGGVAARRPDRLDAGAQSEGAPNNPRSGKRLDGTNWSTNARRPS